MFTAMQNKQIQRIVPGNNFDLEVGQGEGQGHGMVSIERASHKDHACQISMLYH